jgi:hypothetical protein
MRFNQRFPKRLLLLSGSAVVLAAVLIGKWVAGWGLVTIHVKDAPLGRVISSIARQGHVRVESSFDPDRRITLDVDRVTPAEAIDTLALRTDASWRSVVLMAPKAVAFDPALASMKATGKAGDWVTLFYPAPPWIGSGDAATDPALLEWTAEGGSLELPKLLDEAAQKTGVMIAYPAEWAPPLAKPPKSAPVAQALRAMAAGAGGKTLPLFLLTESRRPSRGGAPGNDAAQEGGSAGAYPQTGAEGRRPQIKPEWMEQRALAQIKRLPAEERTAAKKEFYVMKAMFEQLKGLPPEERREKMRELMANPEIAEKMEDRRLLRESKMTAQQRITRAVNYLDRKAAAKQGTPR